MSRINSDTWARCNTPSRGPWSTVVKDPVTVVGCLIGLLILGRQAHAGHSTLVLPICLVPIIVFSRKVRKSAAVVQEQLRRTLNGNARILHRQPRHQGLQPRKAGP